MEADNRGRTGHPTEFSTHDRTNLISFSMYVGIGNNVLSGPHAQTAQNNMLVAPLFEICLLFLFEAPIIRVGYS